MAVGVLVAPELEKSLVQRRGIVTVPVEDATVSCPCVMGKPCHGLLVNGLPLTARALELHMRAMGDRFIARMRVRGYEWSGKDLRLHGPWVSYEFNQRLVDVEAAIWAQAKR